MSDGDLQSVEELSFSTNKWRPRADFPLTTLSEHCAVTFNETYILITGGSQVQVVKNKVTHVP